MPSGFRVSFEIFSACSSFLMFVVSLSFFSFIIVRDFFSVRCTFFVCCWSWHLLVFSQRARKTIFSKRGVEETVDVRC